MRSSHAVLVVTSPGKMIFWPDIVVPVRFGSVFSDQTFQNTLEKPFFAVVLWDVFVLEDMEHIDPFNLFLCCVLCIISDNLAYLSELFGL